LIHCCWRFFKWGLLLTLVVGLIGVPFLWRRVHDEVRAQVQARLAAHYPDLTVRVHFAQIVEGQGIEVRGISLYEKPNDALPLAQIDELFVHCETHLGELAAGRLNATRFVIRRPRIRASRDAAGRWNAARLWPPPKFGPRALEGQIENGTIEIVANPQTPSAALVLRDVSLSVFDPPPSKRSLPGADARGLRGSLLGDRFQRVDFAGWVDPLSGRLQIDGQVAGLRLAPELADLLPPEMIADFSGIKSLRAQAELRFHCDHDAAREPPLQFELAGELLRGRIDDPRLPRPLADLQAGIRLTQEGFEINDLQARDGNTSIQLSCRQTGYSPGSTLRLEAECRRLSLDRAIVEYLPRQWRDLWPKYLPAGEIDASLKLTTNGTSFHPDLTVHCRGVDFTYYKFPYRFERMVGLAVLKDDHLSIDLGDESGAVRLRGEVDNPGVNFSGWIDVEAAEVPFDERLLKAAGERTARVLRSLSPQGHFRATGRCWREESAGATVHKHIRMELDGCSMTYDKFKYPLENLRGVVEMTDGEWTFTGLQATNGDARVTLDGRLTPPAQGSELSLRVTGRDVAMEGELHDALSPNLQRAWKGLRPRGLVNVHGDVRYQANERKLNIWCRIEPQPETASIEPLYFPYRLEKIRGGIVYQDGQITLDGVRAEHGRVAFYSGGDCTLLPEGGWQLRLRGLTVDRLRADRELVHALPGRLQKVVAGLNLTGPVNLVGDVSFIREGDPEAPPHSEWDVTLDVSQASLDAGIRLDGIQGSMRLVGGFDGVDFESRGDLAIDSVVYKDLQFTSVSGPVWIDGQRVLLGAWAQRPSGAVEARSISADLYGGRVLGDCWVAMEGSRRYAVQFSYRDGDLASAVRPYGAGAQRLAGKVHAQVELRGAGRESYNLNGHGSIQLRDAAISELPTLVSLLKLLRVRAPDRTAFNKSDIDFRIEGGHIYFDRINLNGDAISLLGTGEMNMDREIRLTFHSVVGNDEFRIPGIRELLGGASQQTLLVHVGGTLQNPETRYESFPALNHALQQLQIDLQPNTPISNLASPLPRGGP
jgi:hypothetical protein